MLSFGPPNLRIYASLLRNCNSRGAHGEYSPGRRRERRRRRRRERRRRQIARRAQYFIDHTIPFPGFDSDRSHGALLRFYAGYASPVVIDRYESLDAIVEAATENPERRVLERQRVKRWLKNAYDEIGRVNP